jgi:cell division inhibitor SepF
MGSWRKVGAFLGLVPDDSHQYNGDGYESSGYEGGGYEPAYEPGFEAPPDRGSYPGSFARDPEIGRTERPADGYAAARHPADTTAEPAPASHGGRSARRPFGSEPVTQGALAMKADQRRDADSTAASRPASVKLTGFSEARIVGEKYRDGQSVILDMTGMSDADARRLVDFSAGLAFSLRGSIEKVAPKVFMLLPAEADIAGGAAPALEDARAYVGGYARR